MCIRTTWIASKSGSLSSASPSASGLSLPAPRSGTARAWERHARPSLKLRLSSRCDATLVQAGLGRDLMEWKAWQQQPTTGYVAARIICKTMPC